MAGGEGVSGAAGTHGSPSPPATAIQGFGLMVVRSNVFLIC